MYNEIIKYAKNNGKEVKDVEGKFYLQNDGNGDYIKSWSVDGLAQPDAEQLQALAGECILEEKKKEKIKEIEEKRNKVLNKPYKWPEPINGKQREFSVDLLNQLNNAYIMDDIETTPWVCIDNDAGEEGRPLPMLTKENLIAICRHIKARQDTWIVESRRMKNEVLALTTTEEVEAYVVDIPEPDAV